MEFQFTAMVECPIGEVFAFFRDVEQHASKESTRVPVYDKVTPGPVGVGTRYREVVQLAPFVRGVMISEITRYDEGKHLGYRFSGLGMDGDLAYTFEAVEGGTRVVQVQSLRPRGILRPFSAAMGKMFSAVAGQRLEGIKLLLEQAS
jgi:hypothetical protein